MILRIKNIELSWNHFNNICWIQIFRDRKTLPFDNEVRSILFQISKLFNKIMILNNQILEAFGSNPSHSGQNDVLENLNNTESSVVDMALQMISKKHGVDFMSIANC